ncbi:MAG TPA: outer membrane protein assembly factor BamA [Bacteroidales bacterium]|nr:outer membrane protein assembly factor BamA [Bacteroidales bacterium]
MIRRNILLFLALTLSVLASAQNVDLNDVQVMDYSSPKEYEIADVTVTGIEYIQKEVLVSLSGLKVGEKITVPGDKITKVVKKFWDQGLFSDVKIYASRIEDGKIWLNIYMKERPRLSGFVMNGINKSESDDLREKLNVRVGSQVTDDLLNNIRRIIKDHFVEKGFLNVAVRISEKPDTVRVNMVRLKVDIDKNDRVKIDDIVFHGNQVFPDKRLRRVMKKTHRRDINIFKSSKLVKDEYTADKEKLIDFYNENGYRDARILRDSISEVSENRIRLDIFLEEGEKYYIGDIAWIGNTIYPSEYLSTVLGVKKGDVFDQELLDKRLSMDQDAVNSLYLDHGYLFFSLDPVETRVHNDTIDFEMRIREGKQATINRVIIEGNTKTNEHVVRRELRTKPGDLFSKEAIIRSVRELAQLGHFDPEQINPEPIPNQMEGTVDLKYSLVEKANDQLEVSGGWGMGMLVGTIGLKFSNFAIRNFFKWKMWRPVPSGDGQTLSLRAQSNGKYYQAYNMSFVEPWFGGKKPNSFSVSLYHTKMNSSYYSYLRGDNRANDQYIKISGASVGLGKRLNWPDDFFTLFNELSYQRYKLKDYVGYFLFSNGTSHNLSYNINFGRNSVSQPIYPRNGSSFSLSLQLTPPYSLINGKDYSKPGISDQEKYKWIEYHKWKFKADWYTSLAGNLVLYTRAHFGYLGYYNKDIGPSPFEGFDVGGDGLTGYNLYGRETIALRGYENGSLTPLINGNKSGNVYNKYTIELRYPFSLNPSATIFGLVFVEGGNAWYSIQDFNPFLIKRSAGIGLRAFLPMFGLLGIDWGYGFDEIPGQPSANKGQFHFTIGQQF